MIRSDFMRAAGVALIAGCVLSTSTLARDADPAPAESTIVLDTGEVLKGVVTGGDDQSITVSHPLFGSMSVPRSRVKSVLEPGAPAPPPPAPPPPPPPPGPPSGDGKSFLDFWKWTVEIGLAGSDGNSETLNVRGALGGKRETTEMVTTLGLSYIYTTDNGQTSKSRGEALIRNDWNLGDTPWIAFAQGKAEYDEFQDWDWRLSGFGGVGYKFIKNDKTTLIGRIGAGGSYEIGGTNEMFVPEGLLGLDYEHKFNDKHRMFVTAEYYPSFDDFPEYRFLVRGGYEILLDAESNMFFRLGAEDRYDSTPEGRKRNDIDYFATVGWNF